MAAWDDDPQQTRTEASLSFVFLEIAPDQYLDLDLTARHSPPRL